MSLNIESHVTSLVQARKKGERITHLWAEGFHDLIDGAALDAQRVESYLSKGLSFHPEFNHIKEVPASSILLMAILSGFSYCKVPIRPEEYPTGDPNEIVFKFARSNYLRIAGFDFKHAFLPINDRYHFHFPLLQRSNIARFVYTSCENCEGENHGFPILSVRTNDTSPLSDEMREANEIGELMCMNAVMPQDQSPELLSSSYQALENLLKATRIAA